MASRTLRLVLAGLAAVCLLAAASPAWAQNVSSPGRAKVEVVLKSGRTVVGDLVRETDTVLDLQTGDAKVRIYKIDIRTINGKPVFDAAPAMGPSDPGQVAPEEVLIPEGEFLMGDSNTKDRPIHTVYLGAYAIDKYEVTNALYGKFMSETGREAPRSWGDSRFSEPQQPVVGVTWADADAYCRWAGKRLPTEAEWEKAARGVDGLLYPWGDGPIPGLANTRESEHERPLPVGSYNRGASPFGVLDLSGNVWEWVADWYGKEYYRDSPARNPHGPESGKEKVIRGGGWNLSMVDMAFRKPIKPDASYTSLGFRCVRGM